MHSPSRVYAAVLPGTGREFSGNVKEQVSRQTAATRGRELHVTGTAELCRPADRAWVRVTVGNSKESVNEVTNSVSRRLDYISQSLRQHGISDKDTSVRKYLHRESDLYHMDAEVMVTFSDFDKMEGVCTVLLEKLDKSVCVGTPQFYHSAECMSHLRREVCVSAVENAKQKACEISQLLGQSLGPPLLVTEEETREWKNEDEDNGSRGQAAATLSLLPHIPTVTASSRVSASFSLRERSRKKL
ncbi:interleukin-1 receptor-associated kinase 1-binding protein 1 homolog [Echeneis naucrates]|uniref:Interleukin-1 receptor-associated kinase 1-binding protein 1 n=1 Tax=Echeneis naucrates TaxID=173247 RepID=A0A665VSD8_ECHNA|nr:interleukin-1 receptor-associated kinase 1-binding protein 1 [Echeneis naucrates]